MDLKFTSLDAPWTQLGLDQDASTIVVMLSRSHLAGHHVHHLHLAEAL